MDRTMRKEEFKLHEWCKHGKNSVLGKRGVNKKRRKYTKRLIRTITQEQQNPAD